MPTAKLSAKQAAAEIGTDARTLRKFLRSDNSSFEPVGQGSRYEFTSGQVAKLKKQFLAWSSKATKTEKVDRIPKDILDKVSDTLDQVNDEDEITDLEDLDGPEDEELDDEELEIEDLDE